MGWGALIGNNYKEQSLRDQGEAVASLFKFFKVAFNTANDSPAFSV